MNIQTEQIVLQRAFNLPLVRSSTDKLSLAMDLEAANVDLEKLSSFDDNNFMHDIYGILTNMNRRTGKLENQFLPRSVKTA